MIAAAAALAALLAAAGSGWSAPRPEPVCTEPVTTPAAEPCGGNPKSVLVGDTLFVDGRIDGMTYDLIKMPGGATIRHVELNSYGGSVFSAELIAAEIRSKGWTTNVRENGFCASSCLLLLQAGTGRTAHPSARFGVHGVRLGEGYLVDYYAACGDNGSQEACDVFMALWYDESLKATREFFGLMEKYGASPDLLADYMKVGKDPEYYRRANGLRIADWVLGVDQARRYGMLTGR